MNLFETIIIIKPTLEEKQQLDVVDVVKDFINSNGGDVSECEIWGNRKLAYPISGYNDGFYALIKFSGNEDIPQTINQKYDSTEDIIKHIIVKIS